MAVLSVSRSSTGHCALSIPSQPECEFLAGSLLIVSRCSLPDRLRALHAEGELFVLGEWLHRYSVFGSNMSSGAAVTPVTLQSTICRTLLPRTSRGSSSHGLQLLIGICRVSQRRQKLMDTHPKSAMQSSSPYHERQTLNHHNSFQESLYGLCCKTRHSHVSGQLSFPIFNMSVRVPCCYLE